MESRVRKPDVVHLSLPISKKGSANILTPNRSSYRLPTINQHATLIQGTRLGVGLTPSRHTPLESSRHLTRKSMAKRDSRPARFSYRDHSFTGAYRRSYLLAYDPSTGACHCSYLLGPARIFGLHNTALTCLAVLCSFSLVISADSRRRSVCTTCSSISIARSAPSGVGRQLNMSSSSSKLRIFPQSHLTCFNSWTLLFSRSSC